MLPDLGAYIPPLSAYNYLPQLPFSPPQLLLAFQKSAQAFPLEPIPWPQSLSLSPLELCVSPHHSTSDSSHLLTSLLPPKPVALRMGTTTKVVCPQPLQSA